MSRYSTATTRSFSAFSKLEVTLGRQSADDVRLPYRDIAKDGVEFCQETVVDIDPGTRRVQTDVGTHHPAPASPDSRTGVFADVSRIQPGLG